MNRIKIIISILCLTMATVMFSCKEEIYDVDRCRPYLYKIKLLKNSSDNISDEDIYISSSVAKGVTSLPQNQTSHCGKSVISRLW